MNDSTDSLSGKVAIVTGSTSGIGLGIATTLARGGARVVLNGLGDRAQIDTAIDAVRSVASADVRYDDANLLDPQQIEQLVARTVQAHGRLDIVVNNAGMQFVSPVEEFPTAKWDAIIGLNLSAVFHTIRCATPHLLAAGWGRIVNIASAHALVASPYKSAYVAAKHGVAGLTKTVALELATKGVTVNAVAPGYVKTPLVENQIRATAQARSMREDEVVEKVMLAAQPTKRFVTIDQVAAMVAFLCTDEAASINGAVLNVDGGWTAQ
ncbi:MAG: 3-hydroxybutyrate dehydrogenase [Pseudomonadota bacterium]